MRLWRKDELSARLTARELRLAGQTLTALDVTVQSAVGELTTSRLELDLRTTAAMASGGVRGTVSGWSFSGTAVLFRRDRVLLSEAPFELTRGPFVRHRGRAFEWDPVGAWAVVTGVSSVVEYEDAPLALVADRLIYREASRTALFTGSVALGSQLAHQVTLEFAAGHEGWHVSAMQVKGSPTEAAQ